MAQTSRPAVADARIPEARVAEAPRPATKPSSNILPLNFDLLGIETIKKELQKLSATNQEILKAFQTRELPPAKPKEFGSSGNIVLPPEADELAKFKKENDTLRKHYEAFKTENANLRKHCEAFKSESEKIRKIAEALQQENNVLQKRAGEMEAKVKAGVPNMVRDQHREFEQLLEEKTETIRDLHSQVQELRAALEDAARNGGGGVSPESYDDANAQLDRRALELDQIEQRLLADEEALNKQAREMEMSMAKERADLARQRAELQRLQSDVQREIELAARDPGLRERLATLQRRESRPRTTTALPDASGGQPSTSPPTRAMKAPPTMAMPALPTRRPTTMQNIDLDDEQDKTPQQKGLLRRLFGG